MFFVAKDETRVATVISMRRGEIAFGLQDKTCLKKCLPSILFIVFVDVTINVVSEFWRHEP